MRNPFRRDTPDPETLKTEAINEFISEHLNQGGHITLHDYKSDSVETITSEYNNPFAKLDSKRSIAYFTRKELMEWNKAVYWGNEYVGSAIEKMISFIIGSSFSMRLNPFWDVIQQQFSDEEKRKFTQLIERRHFLYSRKENSDHCGEFTLVENYTLGLRHKLIDGECFYILRYDNDDKSALNPLTVQVVSPETCVKIEYKNGKPFLYHFRDALTGKVVPIHRIGPTSGRVLVIHDYEKIHAKQRRGMGLATTVLYASAKQANIVIAVLEGESIKSSLPLWIKPSQARSASKAFDSTKKGVQKNTTEKTDSRSENEISTTRVDFKNPGIIVQSLQAGEELHALDTSKSNSNFPVLNDTFIDMISSRLGISASIVKMNASQHSFATFRGEINVTWAVSIIPMRERYARKVADVIFNMWVLGEIDSGKIKANNLNDPYTFESLFNTFWIGPSKPDIQPLQTAKAYQILVENGWMSNEQVTNEVGGGNYRSNTDALLKDPLFNIEHQEITEQGDNT